MAVFPASPVTPPPFSTDRVTSDGFTFDGVEALVRNTSRIGWASSVCKMQHVGPAVGHVRASSAACS